MSPVEDARNRETFDMRLPLKPRHLPRYRDIARLLIKYGRSDLVRGFEAEELGPDDTTTHPADNADDPFVHVRGGEILERQEESRQAQNGHARDGRHRAPVDDKPAELASDLEAMGTTFVKIGQLLSTRPDLLPAPYTEALSRLQDRVEPFPFAEVERIVERELGVRMSKAFASFEPTPIAAASIGQVHRAELRSGRTVAVKVQRPDVQEQLRKDLDVLADIASFLDAHAGLDPRFEFSTMLEEFRKSLLREVDYRQEARHLEVLGHNLARFERILVPSPVDDYVTTRVLTMEFVHGRKVTQLGPLAKLELDGATLAEDLCRAYLCQIMVDGFFHADPHPGNVFLTDDGRLAILDLGMIGQIPQGLQADLLKLVLAVSEGRGEDAGDAIVKIATPLDSADPAEARRRIAELDVRFHGLQLQELALGRMLFETIRTAAEAGYRVPRELTLLGKTLLNVDEVARTLDPTFDPNASIRRQAAEITRKRMLRSVSPGKMFSGMLELSEFAEKLPRRLNQVLDAVVENRVRMQIDVIDEVLLMEGLQKIANRITVGLIISGMIVGAAMLMRIDTHYRILGYPALAILFFLAAGIAGLVLMINIVFHDLKAAKNRIRGPRKR
jgi:predicted unusual protein kinase regulating ubiquinone biosynthesis (AarF/ABC1/UbiB family)